MFQQVYDSEDATLYLGDNLELLKSLPDDCVDLVLTSPPYRVARKYDIGFNLKDEVWVAWAVERFMECLRVCKGLVCWVVEGQTEDFQYTAEPILMMADLHRRGVKLRKPPIYRRYGIPGSGGPDWVRNDYEFCICAAGGKLPWSDNKAMGKPPKYGPGGAMSYRHADGQRKNARDKKETKQKRLQRGNPDGSAYSVPEISNPGNVIQETYTALEVAAMMAEPGDIRDCKVGGGLMGSDLAHENEAPFPETLTEFFVRSFCPPGGIVLDPFCGSGTSLASAIKWGRMAVGCDVRDTQVELSMQRIEEARRLKVAA
jgi:site-specific DNA-methyltransferase (adenine-specific)